MENKKTYAISGFWFDPGTEAHLIKDHGHFGLYEGTRNGEKEQRICDHREFTENKNIIFGLNL